MSEERNIRIPKINFVIMSGRLVSDSEKRSTSEGKGYLKFRLAVDLSFRRNGKWENKALFIDVLYWLRDVIKGEEVQKRLLKGTPVVVEGKLLYDEWEREGVKRISYYINAYRIDVLETRTKQETGEYYSELDEEGGLPPDEDIPF